MPTRRPLAAVLRAVFTLSGAVLVASALLTVTVHGAHLPLPLVVALAVSGTVTSATGIALNRAQNRQRYTDEKNGSHR